MFLMIFQSTPSVGRATIIANKRAEEVTHFNPRPPWGGRLKLRIALYGHILFQSTPSVGRATLTGSEMLAATLIFQSTPSVGRATNGMDEIDDAKFIISIHALRGEGDYCD